MKRPWSHKVRDFATAFWVPKHYETFKKQTPWALSIGPKISFCVFGNSQWEMEQHCRFPKYQFPSCRFLLSVLAFRPCVPSSSVSSYWVPSSSGPGSRFDPWIFAGDSPVHLLLPCNFPLSQFPVIWGVFVRVEGVNCLFTMVGFTLRSCSILWLTITIINNN